MKRYSTAIFLLAGAAALAGCAGVETAPPQTQRATEPNEQKEVPSRPTVAEPNDVSSAPLPLDEEGLVATDAGEPNAAEPVAIEPNRPATQETAAERAEAVESCEPNAPASPVAPLPQPPGAVQDANEPNDVESAGEADASGAEPAPDPVEPNEASASASEPRAVEAIYDEYSKILDRYVRENGLVDYSELRRRRLDLKTILMRLDDLDPNAYNALSRDGRLAFWINVYNLKVLEIIARNYPIESSWWLRLTWPPSDIRHIEGIWTDYRFMVADEQFTLREVERRHFRDAFDDPRVYLAITYASRSSPPLRRRPYRADALDEQLDRQVRRFLAGPDGLRIDRESAVVRLSALFKPGWRGKEFLDRYGTNRKFKDRDPATRAVLNFLTRYLPREDAYFLDTENYAIEYMNFDWRLNDTARGF